MYVIAIFFCSAFHYKRIFFKNNLTKLINNKFILMEIGFQFLALLMEFHLGHLNIFQ